MFYALLVAMFSVGLIISFIASRLFRRPIHAVIESIVGEHLSAAWSKFMTFALYVVGISASFNLYFLEQQLMPATENFTPPELTPARLMLELFRSCLDALQGITWVMLMFFCFSLIAFALGKMLKPR
ncbi:hypothetical protein [Pseudoalteromonas xiamenensis]|uniref:Uncharacterized protein n=1 Tax=Pseudoalteromonas xiamenensis TaxID=882626 RepID=A0A975DHR2_9GAMM|nr:hypothetical protein [Pseudoalteromonas xiamenensis]QTH72073.1 hypothetical protein J5O05_04030 [Pseudoalteromonas xiamenensis]